MFDRETLKNIPHQPGIYMYHNHAGDIIYVGKAKDLNNRVRQYFQSSRNLTPKTVTLVSHVEWVETIVVDSEMEALILECNLIKEHRPKYNIMLKDDKSYPYIKVTMQDEYPRVLMTRHHKKDGGKYFGPFTSSYAVKQTIEAIGRVYPLRRCKRSLAYGKKAGRPCLNYHIGQCNAPCTGKVPRDAYMADVEAVLAILNGHDKEIVARLTREMAAASQVLDFETAARKRDQIQGITHIVSRQKIINNNEQDQDIIAFAVEEDLACVQVFNVRDGKMIGRDHAFMEGVGESGGDEILTQFIKQYYPGRPFIPREIILSEDLTVEDKESVRQWLAQMRGAGVTLTLPQKGQKSRLAQMVAENARLTLNRYLLEEKQKKEKKMSRLDSLQETLGIPDVPHRVEAYDISNISGADNVGGMVVFTDGRPDPKAYRRFKIKEVTGQNDYGSMQEMLFRRIERGIAEQKEGRDPSESSFLPFPEVMCIDGGKTHVDAVRSILRMYPELSVAVTGLVKNDHHHLRGLVYQDEEYPITYGTPLYTFLNEISEEVHRYALNYHQLLRKKEMTASELEGIPGIGKKRREALLRQFGKIDGIMAATEADLLAVPGMDKRAAAAVAHWAREKQDSTKLKELKNE
jgi:excinuclease ABC subunit C